MHLIKGKIYIAGFIIIICGLSGCNNRKEVVISSEEITTCQEQYETVVESTNRRFDYDDLQVDNVRYLMTEEQVINVLGQPVTKYDTSEKKNVDNSINEKVYSYNDLTIIFSDIDGEYRLTAAASVSDEDIFARDIKVGDTVDKILEKYYRDSDYKNQYWYTEDKSNVLGRYLYGNYTIDQLDKIKTKTIVSYGVINYNGYETLEEANSYLIEFTYAEPPYKNINASIEDEFAQMAFDIDNTGKITSIRWYYYPIEK